MEAVEMVLEAGVRPRVHLEDTTRAPVDFVQWLVEAILRRADRYGPELRPRFLHCRRDPRDVAVSCWITQLRQIPWANDLEHIAWRFAEYHRVMAHWRRVLPVPVLELDYEDMVGNLEGTARRAVAFCGLGYEPACLEYHRTQRPVRTASVTQVRQPIYRRSVARWKHYEQALRPLFTRLEEAFALSDDTHSTG
jgi:hypothetical protein